MGPEDQSQPFAIPLQAATANAILNLTSTTAGLREAVDSLKTEVKDWRERSTRFVDRDELHEHAQQCPGNPRGARTRPPSGALSKIGFWAMAQQRLGVVVSIFILLGGIGGAFIWSVNAASTVKDRLAVSEQRQRKRDESIRAEVKKNLREVLRAIGKKAAK